MVIRVWYQPNGNTANKLIYCIKDRNIKQVIQAWFYREQVVADKQRLIFQPRTICNKDNHNGVGCVLRHLYASFSFSNMCQTLF